ncbi:MAG: LamG domain-containing protein [Candidatus Marsarchaeota archaeon]|nr:LamG domain-containing protein [Candidatus Marsarchaeota archaeon]
MRRKAQSAMEYLMTYGWAILIIAVVLGALFQLGVFNASTFAPRAPPGACQVFRPNGPGNAQVINLEGVCNGELPQYVSIFNGQSYTSISTQWPPSDVTSVLWFESNAISSSYDATLFDLNQNGGSATTIGIYNGNVVGSYWGAAPISGGVVNAGKWYQLALVFNTSSTTQLLYLDGAYIGECASCSMGFPERGYGNGPTTIYLGETFGAGLDSPDTNSLVPLSGGIANVQIYNASLSANEIQALYLEGIGGAPIKLSNIVGWWPLNGNANDYSGDGNNGVPSGVTYTNQWLTGYTPP